jgi:hypothetical protein
MFIKGLRVVDLWKNQRSKIPWDCLFKLHINIILCTLQTFFIFLRWKYCTLNTMSTVYNYTAPRFLSWNMKISQPTSKVWFKTFRSLMVIGQIRIRSSQTGPWHGFYDTYIATIITVLEYFSENFMWWKFEKNLFRTRLGSGQNLSGSATLLLTLRGGSHLVRMWCRPTICSLVYTN